MAQYVNLGVKAITRPPRVSYLEDTIPNNIYLQDGTVARRHSVRFPNSRGMFIVGSYYIPQRDTISDACVIYLHGNASCQLEGTFLIPIFGSAGVPVLCIDTSGCGNSEGGRISLGYYEKDDVSCAISFLRAQFGIKKIVLWGRSMGAATTFLAAEENNTIACFVADSPFASLPDLMYEITGDIGIPFILRSLAVRIVTDKIKETFGFSVADVVPEKSASNCNVPMFIIHGTEDTFINCNHSKRLLKAYKGDHKHLEMVQGDHNSERPLEAIQGAVRMIAECLQLEIDIDNIEYISCHGDAHFRDVQTMMENEED